MLVRYDDPEFSRYYDLVVADGSDQTLAKRQVAALAWNREYVVSNAPAGTKYTATDPHIIDMADLYSSVEKVTGS